MAPTSSEPISIQSFATTQLALLDREIDLEKSETSALLSQSSPKFLQRIGLAILNLQVTNQRTGFGGKTVLELGLDTAVGGTSGKSSGRNLGSKGQDNAVRGGKSSSGGKKSRGGGKSGGSTKGGPSNAASVADDSDGGELPEHSLRTGDIVAVQTQPTGSAKKKEKAELREEGVEGVVMRVSARGISIACSKEEVEMPGGRLWVVKLANDVVWKRMTKAMTYLQSLQSSSYTSLMLALFSHVPPTIPSPSSITSISTIEWQSPNLNESQKRAVVFALAAPTMALIHGPPGTGKTTTLVEFILQHYKRNSDSRILLCGPSNLSVDNLIERLAPSRIPLIRLGHPARLLPSVLNHSLDVLTRTSDAGALVQDIRKEMDDLQGKIRKTKGRKERKEVYGELRDLRKEFRAREKGCVRGLVEGAKVVCATLHGAGGSLLRDVKERFDLVVIDEASQALEAQAWVALMSAKKVILAGDHLQLPPVVKSVNSKTQSTSKEMKNNSEQKGDGEIIKGMTLETSIFDRLLELHGPKVKRMLTVQYRMHEKIMQFPSQELYDAQLTADESVRLRLLKDLPYAVQSTEDTTQPLVFYDTQGGDFPERADEEDEDQKSKLSISESKSNEIEAALVFSHVKALVDAGVRADDIAVITPYNAQLAILSQAIKSEYPGIELGSVDGFQGREKEAVIVSLVRSNDKGEVGFLGEKRRLNVAMTRAKRHLCVVGDSETVQKGSKFLKSWMGFLEEHADLRFPNVGDLS
ncbi:P-loop containing nucleoside triphosphate hydrolase protein [Eremomyces bilateralis CBS 781.70]|uniref:DNA helicase n=1 Tax=Eremomyces bilateralis CBS 781.70 TaxID=1392243 RepID=A0A6G1G9W5_9PEZI|nr:P-loop containing nucleoside triphosphate hydrolase protein [Eremomyces bilateralis CBS 781.70]KAF1814823.1 P-loop containing nucleoside triphosphate hydrolase protein [Eremomyces bilateralis CBS 781.70]